LRLGRSRCEGNDCGVNVKNEYFTYKKGDDEAHA